MTCLNSFALGYNIALSFQILAYLCLFIGSLNNLRDIQDINLSSSLMSGIDTYLSTITAPAGMKVTPDLSLKLFRRKEPSNIHSILVRRSIKD